MPLDTQIKTSENGTQANPTQVGEVNCYPPELMAEYRMLVKKELNGSMMPDEANRFQAVRDQINLLDRQRCRPDTWDLQRAKLQTELAQLRAEIEMLPDAE